MAKVSTESMIIYEMTHGSLFRELLISTLVKAGSLSKSEAAKLCSDMATNAPRYLSPLEGADQLLDATMDRWETLAAGYHGAGPEPRGL